MKPCIGIIMGSDSDLPVMKEGAQFLEEMDIPHEITIVSAHRTPDRLYSYASTAKEKGLKIIIAGAGGAAHLPGMVAAITCLPVIGVPIKTAALSGQDSLYSIVQMPAGIPVATVAINGGKNAAILAAEILGAFDDNIYGRLKTYKTNLEKTVLEKAQRLEQHGYQKYLQ